MRNEHLTEILSSSDQLSAATREWLRNGFIEHIETGSPLQQCLDINRHTFLLKKRNFHLIKAFYYLEENLSINYRCKLLLMAIDNFMLTYSKHKSSGADPLWSDVEVEIFNVLSCRESYPGLRMLIKIITEYEIKEGFDFIDILPALSKL